MWIEVLVTASQTKGIIQGICRDSKSDKKDYQGHCMYIFRKTEKKKLNPLGSRNIIYHA